MKNMKTISNGVIKLALSLFVLLFINIVVNAQTIDQINNLIRKSDLSGTWQTYDANGKAATTGTISQSGTTLNLDNGGGSTATATLSGNTFTAFGLTGTVSDDGNTINWTGGYVWKRQGSSSAASSIDLSGRWQTYTKTGTAGTIGTITQSGSDLTLDNGNGSTATATLNGSTFTAFGLTGTVSDDGKTINWTQGYVWKKRIVLVGTAKITPTRNVSGDWTIYRKDGGRYSYPAAITQNGANLSFTLGRPDQVFTATVSGNQITTPGEVGTLSDDGNKITWPSGQYWVRKSSEPPQPFTGVIPGTPIGDPDPVMPLSKEQQCFNMVQGKVAYDTAGNKNWSDANVRALCKGTTDPVKTIDCFQLRIVNYNDWQRGLRECTPAMLNGAGQMPVAGDPADTGGVSGLLGKWNAYYKDGSSAGTGEFTQNGPALTVDNGSEKKTAVIAGDYIQVDAWNLAGSLSSDGSRIDWSNGSYWIKKVTPHKPGPLSGTWIKYMADGKSGQGNIVQTGDALTIDGFQEQITGKFDGTYIRASDGDAIGTAVAGLKRIDWGVNIGYWVKKGAAIPASRGITFKNESELNGVMIVKYVEDVVTGDRIVPTQRAVATGYIARGGSMTVPLPLNVSPNYEIEITLGAQLMGNFWTTKLPGNSNPNASSTCYKITGSAFNKTGGPCQ